MNFFTSRSKKQVALSIVLFLTTTFSAFSQDLIIGFRQTSRANSMEVLKKIHAKQARMIVPSLGIAQVRFDRGFSRSDASQILRTLSSDPAVKYAFFDLRVVRERTVYTPDSTNRAQEDYFSTKQWNLREGNPVSTHAERVWKEFKVQSRTWQQKEVVAAIIDGGFDLKHPNLAKAIWVNKGEIPGNGKDDDGNGYVDDVNGWNVYNNSGKIPVEMHGTHVAGIIGAMPTAERKIYGIYPSVKVMTVAGSSGNLSTVLKAYGYVLKQKQLYISSQGKLGANVVVVNSSFGVDGANCASDQYKAWNEIYNEMGKYGIINVAATTNNDDNVDVVGDVPTGCDSPYLLSVGRLYQDGHIEGGYGKTTVDLHAPGGDIFSTVPGNSVRPLTGTSMATPHVTGAVAYLFWLMESAVPLNTKDRIQKAPLYVKSTLMNAVNQFPNMAGKTVTGGSLDLYKAARLITGKLEANGVRAESVVRRQVPLRSI